MARRSVSTPGFYECLVVGHQIEVRCLVKGTSWNEARTRAREQHGGDVSIYRVPESERRLTFVPSPAYGEIRGSRSR